MCIPLKESYNLSEYTFFLHMSSNTHLQKTQGFRTCSSNSQKEKQDRQQPVHFARFTYRLSNFNTLESFYLPQEQNNLSQLQGTRQQSITFCSDRITFAQPKNSILTRPSIYNQTSLNPYSTNNKNSSSNENYYNQNQSCNANVLHSVKVQKKSLIGKLNESSHKSEFRFKEGQETLTRRCPNIREESSNLLQRYENQSLSNIINHQSNNFDSHNSRKRSNPYLNQQSNHTNKYQESNARNKKRNHFSIKRQEITSRYQCPQDASLNENKKINRYLDYMQEEIDHVLEGQSIELLIKNWVINTPKYEAPEKYSQLSNRHQQVFSEKRMKENQESTKIEDQKNQKEEKLRSNFNQNESNAMMFCVPFGESEQNRMPTFDVFFNYSGHDSAFHSQDEHESFQFNEFLLN